MVESVKKSPTKQIPEKIKCIYIMYIYINIIYIYMPIFIIYIYMPKVDSSSLEGWECMTCLPFLEAEVHSTWQVCMKSVTKPGRDAFG